MEKKQRETLEPVLSWSSNQFISATGLAEALRDEAQHFLRKNDAAQSQLDNSYRQPTSEKDFPADATVIHTSRQKSDKDMAPVSPDMHRKRDTNRMANIFLETLANRVLENSTTGEKDHSSFVTQEGFHKAMMQTITEFAATAPDAHPDSNNPSVKHDHFMAANSGIRAGITAVADTAEKDHAWSDQKGVINFSSAQNSYVNEFIRLSNPEPEQGFGEKAKKYLQQKAVDIGFNLAK